MFVSVREARDMGRETEGGRGVRRREREGERES